METIIDQKKYFCQICNKKYASASSFSNHTKNHHQEDNKKKKNTEDNYYYCRKCNKTYKSCQSRWNHEKKCIFIETTNDDEIDNIFEENQKLKDDKLKQAEQIIKLQNKIIKSNRLDTKTFKAINKILMDRSYAVNSNNNIRNNNNNNNITNIQQICNIGNEELVKILTDQQKKQIMGAKLNVLERLVEMAHCGEYNQFKNIIITNLKDNFAYKYDQTKGYFIVVEKNELLDAVVTIRLSDIEEIYDELQYANKIDGKTKKIIQSFLDKCNSDEPFVDENNIKFPNFKSYKQNSIKILLYNNQDKITKDIALLISEQ
jgi:hypothetical protein